MSRGHWGMLLLAVVFLAAIAGIHHHMSAPPRSLVVSLGRLQYRLFTPRLAGEVEYRPVGPPHALTHDRSAAALQLRSLAWKLIASSRAAHGGASEQEAAFARLVIGDHRAAATSLQKLAARAPAAPTWTDAAAALLVRSAELDDAGLALDALAATDRALALDPELAAASFNRALALEQLGLSRDARREWRRFLQLDRDPFWTDEALHHLFRLSVRSDSEEWRRLLAAIDAGGAPPDDDLLDRIVARYPVYARKWGEGILVARWADAALRKNALLAASTLDLAGRLGRVLQSRTGETFLADVVADIARASAGGRAAGLARAVAVYRDGRLAHSEGRAAEAEEKFRIAVPLFNEQRSAMIYPARYYLGSALHAQMRIDEAAAVLDALAAENLEQRGYRAFASQIGWERGACFLDRGALSDALKTFDDSRRQLDALGDLDSAATMNAFLAVTLDVAGDHTAAWRARRNAMAQASRSGNSTALLLYLDSAAMTASAAGEPDRAEALLGLAATSAERSGIAAVAAHVYAQRSVVNAELRRPREAAADLRRSQDWARRLPDASRARAGADIAFANAMSVRGRDAAAALPLFAATIAYLQHADNEMLLPRLYLERARTYRLLGDPASARKDLEAGLRIVSIERQRLRDLNLRATLLSSNAALFEEALGISLSAGDAVDAFRILEQKQGRALTEMFLGFSAAGEGAEPLPLASIREGMAADAAIVLFAALPERLVAVVVRRDTVVAVASPVSRTQVVAAMDALRRSCVAVRNLPAVLASASAAHAMLLGPIRAPLAGARHIAFVGDQHLRTVPFAALYDATTRTFLAERATITVAPSATLAVRTATRCATGAPHSVLAVAGSVFDRGEYPALDPLSGVVAEARAVASCYPRRELLEGAAATPDAVLDAASRADLLHIAAHAVLRRDAAREPTLLLAPRSGDRGELRVSDLQRRRLPRTRIAVVAACGVAGDRPVADGVDNIALAFVAAGVPTVVATLWALDDARATDATSAVECDIARGADASDAVHRFAVRQIRDSRGAVALPLQWSNFVVTGGSRRLTAANGGER